jgi:hypothetical protein
MAVDMPKDVSLAILLCNILGGKNVNHLLADYESLNPCQAKTWIFYPEKISALQRTAGSGHSGV